MTFALPEAGTIAIGRGDDVALRIDERSISRRHVEVRVGDGVAVRDLGSANGTRIRGRAIPAGEWADVMPGEVVEVGQVMLVLQQPAESSQRSVAVTASSDDSATAPGQLPPLHRADGESVVIHDTAMARVFQLALWVAPSALNVLLLGETGVGKEIVAEAVHQWSPRNKCPFVRLNCAALSPTLLESELFGHEKGAFTGASASKTGLLEAADGGTVFLDEAGEIPLAVQVKLLRVIEERMVLPVGGLKPRKIDVRFVAATHRDLAEQIARETFREDLFYRLNGITIRIPPLRERSSEIEPLFVRFATRAAASMGSTSAPRIAPAAIDVLHRYPWPGNVRELRNVAERSVVLARGAPVDVEHLPPEVIAGPRTGPSGFGPAGTPATSGANVREELAALERQRIIEVLERCAGNQSHAAEVLGIPRRTLIKRLHAYGLIRGRGTGS